MKRKIIDGVFIAIVLLFVTAGLVTALFYPKEINEYENRYAEKFERLTLKSYMDKTFQDSMEAALSDRVNFAEGMKKSYNDAKGLFIRSAMEAGQDKNSETVQYIKVGDVNVIGDNIVYSHTLFDWIDEALDKRVALYNELYKNYPEIEFYLYYIEKDTDINFETGEKTGVFEYLYENLDFKKENMDAFKINSFEEFKAYFYKTDHHWQEDGAHKGYEEVLKLLSPSETPLQKGEKELVASSFAGSKAVGDTAGYREEFWAYRYETPPMTTIFNGEEWAHYGLRDEFMNGEEPAELTYDFFYGTDAGEVIFDTGNTEKDNVLIIGESYDNAILKLLGGHFNRVYSVDLRNYEYFMGKEFRFREYVREHDIDKVLFIGNVDFITLDTFDVEE